MASLRTPTWLMTLGLVTISIKISTRALDNSSAQARCWAQELLTMNRALLV